MELHAASIQALQLLPCTSMLTLRNSALLCAACLRLCRMHHSAGTLHDAFAPRDSTITWRPKYCKDVFLFLSADTDAVVVGMAQTDTTEFFSAQDASAPHPFVDEACTVFAHLTCDVHEDRSAQMVLLCYDVLEHKMLQKPLPPSQRYQRLLQMQPELESMRIGTAAVRMQWVGSVEVHDKVRDLRLPHEKDAVVEICDADDYRRHRI
jgi:hypothetical protein